MNIIEHPEPSWLLNLRKQRKELEDAKAAGIRAKMWSDEADAHRKKIRELGAHPVN